MLKYQLPETGFDLRLENFIEDYGGVRCFFAKKFTIACIDPEKQTLHKIARVIFGKSGIMVQLTYFGEMAGIVGCFTPVHGGENQSSRLDLRAQGRRAPAMVKYSHHVDGRAHFSQDGKVQTKVGRQAFPLNREGFLFDVTVIRPQRLKSITPAEQKKNELYVPYPFTGGLSEGLKLSASWWSMARLREMHRVEGEPVGPLDKFYRQLVYRATGKTIESQFLGALVSSSKTNPTHVLVLSASHAKVPGDVEEPSMFFMGGFDEGVDDLPLPKECLFATYPFDEESAPWASELESLALPAEVISRRAGG